MKIAPTVVSAFHKSTTIAIIEVLGKCVLWLIFTAGAQTRLKHVLITAQTSSFLHSGKIGIFKSCFPIMNKENKIELKFSIGSIKLCFF